MRIDEVDEDEPKTIIQRIREGDADADFSDGGAEEASTPYDDASLEDGMFNDMPAVDGADPGHGTLPSPWLHLLP